MSLLRVGRTAALSRVDEYLGAADVAEHPPADARAQSTPAPSRSRPPSGAAACSPASTYDGHRERRVHP
jgi:hypothetical protein